MFPIIASPRRIKLQPDFSTLYIKRGVQTIKLPINESAASILSLCTGSNSINKIIDLLAEKYNEELEVVSGLVTEFINNSAQMGTICWSPNPSPEIIDIRGSKAYYTPDIIVIEITKKCPLSCKHCFQNSGPGNSLEMDRGTLEGLCEEIVSLGVDVLQLTGGEPLIYPGVEQIIKALSCSGIILTITTNGMVGSPSALEALKTMKGTGGWIQVSIDGLEETHNYMRENKQSYSKAISFIKSLVAIGLDVNVATCVTEESIGELKLLSQLVKDLGVRIHRIGCVSERGRAIEKGIKATSDFRQRVHEDVEWLKTNLNSQGFAITGFEDNLVLENKHKKINCGAGYRVLKLSPEGNIHPCPLMDNPIGSIRKISLTEFIKTNGLKFASVKAPSAEICGNCEKLVFCHDCMAEALLHRNSTECQWSAKQGIDVLLLHTT